MSGAMSAAPSSDACGGAERIAKPAFTPGPWAWFGSPHGLYLATIHSGRRYVMSFRRMGTQGAQPAFQVNQRMVPASQLAEFEVGDGTARGFAAAKADPSVYRYDVAGIDAPDARLIAAAPELYEALRVTLTAWAAAKAGDIGAANFMNAAEEQANAALAKARGDAR